MAGSLPSRNVVPPTNNQKKRAPVFLPKVVAKKRKSGGVRRTHSPLKHTSAPSPCSVMNATMSSNSIVNKLSPTVEGVEEGVRNMVVAKRRLAVPTETVYMVCSTINTVTTRDGDSTHNGDCSHVNLNNAKPTSLGIHSTLILESSGQLNLFLSLPKSSYAIRLPNGKATKPVRLNESMSVLHKLSKKYWPGPLAIYLSVDSESFNCCIPTYLFHSLPEESHDETNNKTRPSFLPLTCPSHPLLGRVLMEVSTKYSGCVVIGTPTLYTSAREACEEYNDDSELSVLCGEERRESFSVPTCQHGRTCTVSLWISFQTRQIYICGSKNETMVNLSVESIQRALLKMQNPSKISERVTCSVLKKWSVVDKRV